MAAWNEVLILAPLEISDEAEDAFWKAMEEYEDLKEKCIFPRKALPAFLWSAMVRALPQDEFAQTIDDFCRAVLAGNRPAVGEPFDTIYRHLRLRAPRKTPSGES